MGDFPSGDPQPLLLCDTVKRELLEALGLMDVPISIIRDVQFCQKTKKLLLILDKVENVLDLKPSSQKLLEVQFSDINVRGVICSTNDTKLLEHKQYDIVSRYFSPWNGIPEDPVTGSAHTVLGKYWWDKLKHESGELHAFQASPGRGGELFLQLDTEQCS